jgi:thiamine pyrophosphate-dependent acetolactate synthase large subunit-like protein
LQSAGVKHCYGVVGDTLNLIARSLEKSEIEWVSVRHEEAGAFAAQAEAQVADRLTAVAGSCGETVSSADQLETAVKDWLAQPGPALLHVHVNPMQLVMPPFMQVEPAVGMALYSARAILHGRGGDVWEMVRENFL